MVYAPIRAELNQSVGPNAIQLGAVCVAYRPRVQASEVCGESSHLVHPWQSLVTD